MTLFEVSLISHRLVGMASISIIGFYSRIMNNHLRDTVLLNHGTTQRTSLSSKNRLYHLDATTPDRDGFSTPKLQTLELFE